MKEEKNGECVTMIRTEEARMERMEEEKRGENRRKESDEVGVGYEKRERRDERIRVCRREEISRKEMEKKNEKEQTQRRRLRYLLEKWHSRQITQADKVHWETIGKRERTREQE